MELNRARIVDENFQRRVLAKVFPPAKSTTLPQDVGLSREAFLELFKAQLISRHLDLLARILREKNLGFYTIGSSGHEGNAAIASAFRKDDMAFLHYRSGAFVIARAQYDPDIDITYEQILSLVASSEDPISGGRHKVFGSVPLWIPPQTSTIASHLPKALGAALSITQAKRVKHPYIKLRHDSVVLCSFGDASINHSTAQGAFNAAQWIMKAGFPLPLVWICEDNEIGISVQTPPNWVEKVLRRYDDIHYIFCDGRNIADVYKAAKEAENLARKKGKPVFLHMKTVRLLGHAGSDIEFHYHSLAEIESAENDDPLLHSARTICLANWLTPQQVVATYESVRENILKSSERALATSRLKTKEEIMSSIIPPKKNIEEPLLLKDKEHKAILPGRTMAQCINMALTDILLQYPNTLVFGEDVGKKGGVYRITADLQQKFGQSRVFDTLLDEQTILGVSLGLAHNGFLPIPEIQFLAYIHNAIDQIRGEAATLSFFSKGQYTNPMVVRIPSLGYQKGFGGHFHNDNAIGFLREIPGIVIAVPSTPRDAALLLRQCVRLAFKEQRVVIFLEPIALYMTKDLFNAGDGLALNTYPDISESLPFGEMGIEEESISDTVIISYGNGMHLSRQAASILKQQYKVHVKLIDLRWLAPLNTEMLAREIQSKSKILIVDEGRRTGSLSETLTTWIIENIFPLPKISRLTGEDCFVPLGTAWEAILPSCDNIVESILALTEKR